MGEQYANTSGVLHMNRAVELNQGIELSYAIARPT